jgi:hypothetical protein
MSNQPIVFPSDVGPSNAIDVIYSKLRSIEGPRGIADANPTTRASMWAITVSRYIGNSAAILAEMKTALSDGMISAFASVVEPHQEGDTEHPEEQCPWLMHIYRKRHRLWDCTSSAAALTPKIASCHLSVVPSDSNRHL